MRNLVLIGIILATALSRIIPHPPNFTPLIAVALLGGATLNKKYLAFSIPVLSMFIADMVLGFHQTMIWGYSAMILITYLGMGFKQHKSMVNIGVQSVVGSLLFFLISNFGVWMTGLMYPKTITGLGACYVAGLPFLTNTLASTLLYSAVLFGGFVLIEKMLPQLQTESAHS
jgi:hypothetical protein